MRASPPLVIFPQKRWLEIACSSVTGETGAGYSIAPIESIVKSD
jgi:hypothetical protein